MIVKKTREEQTQAAPAWRHTQESVTVVAARPDYVLLEVDAELEAALESAPCEISVTDGVVLIPTDRYTKCAAPNSFNRELTECDWIADVKGTAKILLRHAEYDYTYKGRKGHTSTIRLAGISWREIEPTEAWYR